jgi:hypothetical protein
VFRSIDLFNLDFRFITLGGDGMSYVKEFLVKEFCEQCGFELLEDEEQFCGPQCKALATWDQDEWQFDECDYKVEPKSSDE